jgi:hypothetical protein
MISMAEAHEAENPSASKCPSWVPESVIARLRHLEGQPEGAEKTARLAIMLRIVTDDRMQAVWRELRRRARDRNYRQAGYFHPARIADAPSPEAAQQAAIGMMADVACSIAAEAIPIWTPAERDRHVIHLKSRVEMLRAEAADTEALGGLWVKIASGMRAKADFLEEQGIMIMGGKRFISPYARENAIGLAAGERIRGWMERLFGDPLPKISAIMAGVATGETVTPEMLRYVRRTKGAAPKDM